MTSPGTTASPGDEPTRPAPQQLPCHFGTFWSLASVFTAHPFWGETSHDTPVSGPKIPEGRSMTSGKVDDLSGSLGEMSVWVGKTPGGGGCKAGSIYTPLFCEKLRTNVTG